MRMCLAIARGQVLFLVSHEISELLWPLRFHLDGLAGTRMIES